MTAGWIALLARARIYRRLLLVELALDETPVERPAPGLEVRLLGAGDVAAYVAYRADPGAEEVGARLGRGELCAGAWREGRLISAVWAARGRAHIAYLDRELALGPDEAYAYESFTARAERGRDIASYRSNLIRRMLREAGVRRLVAAILPETPAVRRRSDRRRALGHERTLGVVGYVGLGPWRRHFFRAIPGG